MSREEMERAARDDYSDEEGSYEEDYDEDDGADEDEDEDEEEEITEEMLNLPPEEPIAVDTNLDNILFVDNLPVVADARFDKLLKVVDKICGTGGKVVPGGVTIPKDDSGKTMGFAYVEYVNPPMAAGGLRAVHGYKLDKTHTLKAMPLSEMKRILEMKTEYVPLEKKEYEPRENLLWAFTDSRGRDQYVIRYQDETEVLWNDPLMGAESLYQRKNWTEDMVRWSPLGTYLVTFHRQGIVLWGGPTWAKLMRFHHPGVKAMEFSPKENYLVTFNNTDPAHDNPKDPRCIIVWDVRTGRKLRSFLGNARAEGPEAGRKGHEKLWPVFKWSHDDKYIARQVPAGISVYQTPSMGLLDKKTISIPNIMDFCWSPGANLLSYWIPEVGQNPARVAIMEVPTRKDIAQKNLFSVADCRLHWQSKGKYLCVKVDRFTKTKKSIFTNFELFRLREKNIPTEVVEISDHVHAFAWEPKGSRFAMIHGEPPSSGNKEVSVSFYDVQGKGVKRTKLITKKNCNHLFWSPQGHFLLLAGLRNLNGSLEFWNVDEGEMMGADEHFMCTDVEWDPTGRFVATSVSYWRQQMENGYTIWNFHGKLVHQVAKEHFYQILWRPRPPSMLSDKEEREIKKNLKNVQKSYQDVDNAIKSDLKAGHARERRKLRDDFAKFQESKSRKIVDLRRKRREQRGGAESDVEDLVEIEREVEELLEESVQVVEE